MTKAAPYLPRKNEARCRRWIISAIALCSTWIPFSSGGQEAVRMSLASAEAAEARRKAATTLGYHNLKLGPTAWNFMAALGLEYTDNLYFQEENQEQDLGIRPGINTRMIWPLSERNSINLAIGGGYAFYLNNPEFNRYFINPGTELSFDVYIGDVWINLHDRLSIVQDVYSDPSIVGSVNHSRLENSIGATAVWDMNKLLLKLGYDHTMFTSIQAGSSSGRSPYPDGSSDVVYGSLGYVFAQNQITGLEYGFGMTSYDLGTTNVFFADSFQWNTGIFAESQISEYLKGRASLGYTTYTPDAGGADSESGIYADIGVTHRLNKYVDYSISGGRRVTFSFYGGALDMYTVNLNANWRLLRKINLSTGFTYENGSYVYAYDEQFERFSPNVMLSRWITENLAASLNYRFYLRQSDKPFRGYTANIVGLSLAYRF